MTAMQARPKHVLSWGFNLYEDGQFLVGFDMAWFREGGRFQGKGHEYRLSREGLWSGDFLLTVADNVVARARKASALRRRFTIWTSGREFTLEASSLFSRRFQVIEQDTFIGQIVPHHPFTRVCRPELPADLIVPVRVLLFFLAALMWRRAAHTGSSD